MKTISTDSWETGQGKILLEIIGYLSKEFTGKGKKKFRFF